MLNKKQIAEHYAVSVPTIDRLMKEGLPYVKVGKNVRFDLDEVKEWLKNKREK